MKFLIKTLQKKFPLWKKLACHLTAQTSLALLKVSTKIFYPIFQLLARVQECLQLLWILLLCDYSNFFCFFIWAVQARFIMGGFFILMPLTSNFFWFFIWAVKGKCIIKDLLYLLIAEMFLSRVILRTQFLTL